MDDFQNTDLPALQDSGRPPEPSETRAVQPLDRLCSIAARLLDVETAVVSLLVDDVKRTIASAGLNLQSRSRVWDFSCQTFGPEDEVILPDATTRSTVQAYASYLGLPAIGFFLRGIISLGNGHALTLIAASSTPKHPPKAADLAVLDELKALIRAEFSVFAPLLLDPGADVTAALSLEQIRTQITAAPLPTLLLDRQLTIRVCNAPMAHLLCRSEARIVGATIDSLNVPTLDAQRMLYQGALDRKLSTPDFEVVIGEPGHRRLILINASPFSPVETHDYFLVVTARDITEFSLRERNIAYAVDTLRSETDKPAEPTLAFLKDTLVQRRAIRARKSVHFLTLRSWRSAIREWQIKALHALKANLTLDVPNAIAEDIWQEIESLVGLAAFRAIVPMPCGHTREGACLSVEIARALGQRIQIPVVQAIAAKPQKGRSHPKENLRRPPMMLMQPLEGPVLLVDDVATSGAHIEEAVSLLKPGAGSVMAVAWISGDSA